MVEFDKTGRVLSIEEKPQQPKSSYALTGLYFFDNRAIDFSKAAKSSKRGELEITTVMQNYFDLGQLAVQLMHRRLA